MSARLYSELDGARIFRVGLGCSNFGKRCDGENGEGYSHPTRSARANRPVGLKMRTAMMITKPIASR